MNRSSCLPQQSRRLVVFSFLIVSVLLLLTSFNPWVTTQAGSPLAIKEAETASSSAIGAMTLRGAGTAKPNSATEPQSNPQLTVNKTHVNNPNDPVSGPPAATTWQPGVPITYVITVENSGAGNSNISVADALPSGFVLVAATYTASAGATGPSGALGPPPFSPFNIPMGGKVEIRITGYFTTAGSKINTATASATDGQGNVLNVGASNSSTDQLTVVNGSTVNVAATKSVSPTTATFPAHVHFTIKVANTMPTGVFLGKNLQLRDAFAISPFMNLNWTISDPVCTPAGGAICPDMPVNVPNNTGTIVFPYDLTGASAANDTGWLPGNSAYTIEFDVDITTPLTCGPAQVSFLNQAILDSLSGFNDAIQSDNFSQQIGTSISTGLKLCPATGPAAGKIQCSTLTGPCVSAATASWNTPVRYQVTVSNPTAGALNLIPLSDKIWKDTGTPTFTATVAKGPCLSAGCTSSSSPTMVTNPVALNPTLNSDGAVTGLWTGELPSLAPSQSVVIEYTVVYAPVCETDAQADVIANRIVAGSASFDMFTTMTPEADTCKFATKKTAITPGPIVFEQPATYQVVFTNASAATQDITVRDALSLSSSQYGNFTFNYSTSCTVTAGTVSPVPPSQTNLLGTVFHQPSPWKGVRLIDAHPTFGPMSTLTCQVTVTAHKPPDGSPLCQGDGTPQLVNASYMDLSTNYSPNFQPTFYEAVAKDLPLCRSVIVTKVAADHSYGPGATVPYTITVENKGKNAVSSFVLQDNVPAVLLPATVSACNPAAACTSAPTINIAGQVNVGYGLLAPNVPVSFTLTATAPQAGGSYRNLAVGSFPPGGNFYFQGDEANFLQQEENIQVLTPNLAKRFDPAQIGPGGTSTLTFNITNTNSDPKQTGMSFSDTLQAGLQITGVVANGCGGSVTTSTDGHTVTLVGGQLVGPNADGSGKHSCQISVTVKAANACGVFRNDKSNFSQVKNLDVSSINAQLEVTGCPVGGGLTVQKIVKGAPRGFQGQFNFLVQCATPNGFYQKAVTVNWPTPGFVTLNDVPAGSQCTVTEGPTPTSLPANYNWDGLPSYSPEGGVVTIGPRGGGQVTVTNSLSLCNETGQVTITKIVKGLPKDYIGTFQGTLQCWTADKLVNYPVTLVSPNGLSTTIGNIPLGSTCTFQETGQPPLAGDMKWNQPIYSPKFGTVTLTGECCQQITVTNEARHCCSQSDGADSGSHNYSQQPATEQPAGYAAPNDRPPVTKRRVRGRQR